MKRVTFVLLCLVILFAPSLGICSEVKEYNLDEINLQIRIPKEFIVLTRNNMDGLENLLYNYFGTTKEKQLIEMKNNNSYLRATTEDCQIMFTISRVRNSDPDYSRVSDVVLLEAGKRFNFNDDNDRVVKVTLHKSNGLKWIVPYYITNVADEWAQDNGMGTAFTCAAMTTENGYLYIITFTDFVSTEFDAFKTFVERIVDSIKI